MRKLAALAVLILTSTGCATTDLAMVNKAVGETLGNVPTTLGYSSMVAYAKPNARPCINGTSPVVSIVNAVTPFILPVKPKDLLMLNAAVSMNAQASQPCRPARRR